MNKEWFKDWFESDEYLEIYKHRDDNDAKKLLKLILNNIEIRNKSSVLDVACGAGRHSLLFAENGFNVTAFDLSKNLLRIAKKKSDEQSLKINFFCGDIRNLALKHNFSLVLNLFTSFGYFESDDENFALFKDAYNYLEENGYFILDYFNAEYLKNNLIKKSVDLIDGREVIQERHIDVNRINKKIIFKDIHRVIKYSESVRLFAKYEIIDCLKNLGFKLIKVYGDYDGVCFNNELSPRLIIFAMK